MNDENKTSSLAGLARKIWEEGAEMMWRNVLADTVLEILAASGQVTRDNLRGALEAKADAPGCSGIERATLRGALNALDGRPPVS